MQALRRTSAEWITVRNYTFAEIEVVKLKTERLQLTIMDATSIGMFTVKR